MITLSVPNCSLSAFIEGRMEGSLLVCVVCGATEGTFRCAAVGQGPSVEAKSSVTIVFGCAHHSLEEIASAHIQGIAQALTTGRLVDIIRQ